MRNRLGQSLSPYLRQHASNPVAWWEWGPEAFEEARERDLPILLSVGYAACHWCHVMAHESFADEHVAGILNEHFVAIKVDREERPDIDAVYLAATTAMTGRAGWPMTCFLTPTGEPFYAGTYYPKPQFLQLLEAVRHAWSHRRADVHSNAGQLTAALRETAGPPRVELSPQLLEHAQELLAAQFDEERGGFGDAPKFPPSMVLEWLLRRHARTGSPQALRMASLTCSAMARGGVYDQLAGGFARYSVDADWVVPHFEKMLYDNAQLLAVYAHLWRLTGDETARRVAQEIGDFLITDLGTDQGAFASALDADAAGIEGLTYAWTPAQLLEVLGEADGQRAAQLLSVTDKGTFEHGTSTLQLRADWNDRTSSSPRAAVPMSCSSGTSSTAGCAEPPSAKRSVRRPGSPTTTATSPPDCSPSTRPSTRRHPPRRRRRPGPGIWLRPGHCSMWPPDGSAPTTAGSTTPPLTRTHWSSGLADTPTTPNPVASPRSHWPCSRMAR